MAAETHAQLANFFRSVCNRLRWSYKQNQYREAILPVTVLRRFDCILVPTKAAVLKEHAAHEVKPHINRHFHRYEPPRPLEVMGTDIKKLEAEILDLLKEVTS